MNMERLLKRTKPPEPPEPPELSFKLKKAGDVPICTETWSDDHLPIDVLLLTGVESCDFLSCFTLLDQPFRLHRKDIGFVYIGRMGKSSVQEKLKVALMNCYLGAAAPGGSLTVVLNAVRVLQPKAVFLVGTCISLDSEKARMGDVVISSKLSTAEGYRTPVSPRLGSLVRDAPYGWNAPLKNPDELEVKVHCDGDILSQPPRKKCRCDDICEEYPGAVATETEGEGVFAAAHDANIEWVVVKGVASYFHQSHSSTSKWRSFASTMAASVVGKMLDDPAVFREWPHYNQVSDPFDPVKYISIIRKLYEDREGWLAPFPWCEEFRFNLDTIFTRLKFVSRKKERGIKTDDIVDMFQIFQPHQECSQPRRVLIEGQPGMGKTTYCHKIAYDWAKKRKGGESFPDVPLVLLLKCRDINCGPWEAIDDQLLPREVNEEEKERFFTFIRDHQSKVLLVLDGLDELPRSQLSIYTDIIRGRVLPASYILVTARHEVGVKVRECCHTLLEVEGFTETDVEKFIRGYFKEEEHLAKKLLDKLNSEETLQDLTRNPLNTALLCLLCEEPGEKFPESRTLLYLGIVECVLRRYRRKMKLPETKQDLLVLYKVELEQLGFIAMEGLHNDSMYFDESALEGSSSDVKSGLGFLSVKAGRSKRRPSRSYAFLHRSFQEFFAALFHCYQLLDGKISVDSLIADRRYFYEFEEVLMFMSGLLAQKCEAAAKALIAGIAAQVNLQESPLSMAWYGINECKREGTTFDKEMAQFFGSHLKLQTAHCEGLTKELLAVCIETLKTNSTVTELVLVDFDIDHANAAELVGLLKENSTLTSLTLSNEALDDVGVDTLAKGLKENSTLTSLDLRENQIGDVGADALAKGLKENSMLTSLDLSYNAIGNDGADALAKGLKENSTLTSLDLCENQIGDVGADALAKGLKENSTLTSLDLSCNAIGNDGADALAKGLKENSTLTSLALSYNAIGNDGADALAKGLKENSTLTSLDLSENQIGDVGADALAKGLEENSSLTSLDLCLNLIGSDGGDALAKGLKENSTLTSLDLSANNIGDVGADALAKGLKENSTLTLLNLYENQIGDVGADALAKGLKENSTLTSLDLGNNQIGDVGADALVKALKENSTLISLPLTCNPIGNDGADALVKGT